MKEELEDGGHEEMKETTANGPDVAAETEADEGPAFKNNPVLMAQFATKLAKHVKKYKNDAGSNVSVFNG